MSVSVYEPGSMITIDRAAWTVSGRIDLADGCDEWTQYLLRRDVEQAWASVHADSECWSFLQRRRAADLNVVHERAHDALFTEIERGHAVYRAHGDTGDLDIPASGVLTYIDYTAAGDRMSLERFHHASPWWVSVSDPGSLTA